MFFSIGLHPELNYSNFYQLGNFCVSTDAGWHKQEFDHYQVLYKGYADTASVDTLLPDIVVQKHPTLLGNFCVLAYDKNSKVLKICTDRYRSFPIYFARSKQVNNLIPLEETGWADSLIEIHENMEIVEIKFDVIGEIDDSSIDPADMLKQLDQLLIDKTLKFASHNQLPMKSYLSGGADSLLVYSYLKRCNIDFELVCGEHIDYDEFWMKNSGTLKKYWGYTQIHHWKQPCMLSSGTPGDEYMLRSPTTSNLWLLWNGTSIIELLDQYQWKNSYHYSYFAQPKHVKLFESQTIDSSLSKKQVIWKLCNILVNDWQHWHLGQTLTWTPLRDLDIIKLFFRLPLDIQKSQIMNSEISRQLIENNTPGMTNILSDQKNVGNLLKNLVNFYKN